MGDRFAKTDDNKKILYIDANNLCGVVMDESLPYNEIEMWRGHPSCYREKLEDILKPPDLQMIVLSVLSWKLILHIQIKSRKKRKTLHLIPRIEVVLKVNLLNI